MLEQANKTQLRFRVTRITCALLRVATTAF
jgi:hypothetical protein